MPWDQDGNWTSEEGQWTTYDDGGPTVDWYNPETGEVEQLTNPDYHPSPYEMAEQQGRLPEFQDYIDTLYGADPTGAAATEAGVNLYDPSTYGLYPPDAQPSGSSARSGASAFRNPTQQARDLFPAPGLPNRPPAPRPLAQWTGQFKAPTLEEATSTPGFQFRIGEGLKALQRSAAAKGTLLTGGTLKGLVQYTGDEAGKEYRNVYNRAYNEYDTERQNFLTNEVNRYNSERANRGDDFSIDSGYFNMGRANRLDDFNIWNTMDSNYYNRLLALAGVGNPGQMGGFNANYGNIGADTMTGIGNAMASGQIGSANAWSNALGSAGNSALLAALLRRGSV